MNSQTLPLWADVLASALLIVGAGFTLVGAIGLARLPDFYKRLHAPSKATTLGVGCTLLASALVVGLQGQGSLRELLITLFLFITAPVSAQLLIGAVLKSQPGDRPPVPPAQPVPTAPGAAPVADTESPPPPPAAPAAPPG